MINVLTHKLPTVAVIDGVEYHLNTDFKDCILTMIAFEDKRLTNYEKYSIMLENVYGDNIPDNMEQAILTAIDFLDCKDGTENSKNNDSKKGSDKRVYSFKKDAKYIYSAFKQTHDIDLESVEYMHWWKFLYLFQDLNDDCFFSRIVYLRNQRNNKKLTKEEKEYCLRIKDILDLSDVDGAKVSDSKEKTEFMRRLNKNKQNTVNR